MTEEQRDIEKRAGQIIWAAASLAPGVPGYASRTAALVARMCALIREVQGQAPADRFCTTHGRAHWNDGDRTCQWVDAPAPESPTGRTPEPPKLQQLPPPMSDEDRKRLLEHYAPQERRY